MSLSTRLFAYLMVGLGALAVASAWPFAISSAVAGEPLRYVAYLILAVLSACLKVRLPGVNGTMSVLFVVLLISISEKLSPAEVLSLAGISVCGQIFWATTQRPKLIQAAFNVAGLLLAVRLAQLTYEWPMLRYLHLQDSLRIMCAATVFFLINTLPVATVISLSERKSVRRTWNDCYFWSFPYYLVGASLAALFHWASQTQSIGWQAAVMILPVVVLIYRNYRFYLDRLEEANRHQMELQAAADRLNAVLESTTDCVLAVGRDWKVTYSNERARVRFRMGEPANGRELWDIFRESPELRTQCERAISNQTAANFELHFAPLQGWFEVHAYPVPDGLAIYLHEVSEKRLLEDQLRQSQKMEAVGRLAGGVAHDFNNLLTVILGYAHVLSYQVPATDEPVQRNVMEIQKAGERAASLTQQLLAFSRKQVVQPQILDGNGVIADLKGMLERLLGEEYSLDLRLQPGLARVKADKGQLEQVVMNLVVNARDAMLDGGEIVIRTSTEPGTAWVGRANINRNKQYVCISVVDTGHGMDAETKQKIFDPFFTTKEKGKGTGLGLSIVYGIVEQSGGAIAVDSEPHRGATFTVLLPAVAVETDTQTTKSSAAAQTEKASGTLLLVEDEDGVRLLAKDVLEQAGYVVHAFANGPDAIQQATRLLPQANALITDVVMPGMHGPELAALFQRQRKDLKVLFISGYTDHPSMRNGSVTAAEFLQKPFSPQQLLAKVHALLSAKAGQAKA